VKRTRIEISKVTKTGHPGDSLLSIIKKLGVTPYPRSRQKYWLTRTTKPQSYLAKTRRAAHDLVRRTLLPILLA